MNSTSKNLWQFSFDLDTEKLKKYYPGKSYTEAYRKIRHFLYDKGFDDDIKKQGSCYFTQKPMKRYQAVEILKDMYKNFLWLRYCTKRAELSLLPQKVYDFNKMINRMILQDKKNNLEITYISDRIKENKTVRKPKTL